MPAVTTFSWKIAPSAQLIPNLDGYRANLIAAIHELGGFFAAKMQTHAQQIAPWADRTGAARQGLAGFAETAATGVVIYLVTSVSYGKFLETGTYKMAPRPSILPTLEAHHGEIMSALRALVA